jgi:site-specific recombinase XerD
MAADHLSVLDDYKRSHERMNHSTLYIEDTMRALSRFFESRKIVDESQPQGVRGMFVFDLLKPHLGRTVIKEFSDELNKLQVKSGTKRKTLRQIRHFCDYVLQHPVIPKHPYQPIMTKYGAISQPVFEYDYPRHVADTTPPGRVLTESQLIELYKFLLNYAESNPNDIDLGRDVAMIVLAAESNLRANELRMTDVVGPNRALFYNECKVRTTHAKGFRGSGPLTRTTIFTPFAKAVMRIYEETVRPRFPRANLSSALFLTNTGDRITCRLMRKRLTLILDIAGKAGIDLPPGVTWHSLRRTFATLYLERQSDHTAVLAGLLGHRTLNTLQRYVIHNQDYLNRVIKQIHDDLMPNKDEE